MKVEISNYSTCALTNRCVRKLAVIEAIVFLATDRANFIYGAKLAVDGGRTAI